jgi:hypothetical protein
LDKVDDADVATAAAAALAAAGERSVEGGLGVDAVFDVMVLSLDDEEMPTMLLPMVVRFLAQ